MKASMQNDEGIRLTTGFSTYTPTPAKSSSTSALSSGNDSRLSFSHIQFYVDKIEPLMVYKKLEESLNQFHDTVKPRMTMETKADMWGSVAANLKPTTAPLDFASHNQDFIKQLLIGFGFRITGFHNFDECSVATTRSLLFTSKDPNGVQFVVSAAREEPENAENVPDEYSHFSAVHMNQFFECHAGRQGIAVLGFQTENLDSIQRRYEALHPLLIKDYKEYQEANVLQVYAYYAKHDNTAERSKTFEPDRGTLLRFVQVKRGPAAYQSCILPGFAAIDAMFDEESQPAYCDHWISNVHSRTEFLKILEDTLGFTPKVDFNAGVVAAGEAQIESTVTGNVSVFEPADKTEALRDQSQVFLPINNALSSKGHVHGFLEEIGQGVQHVASRVDNLVGFVEYCNHLRAITGEGFSFLDIPRSYYGVLTVDHLQKETAVSKDLAMRIVRVCEQANIMSMDGAVDLDLSIERLSTILDSMLGDWEDCLQQKASYEENRNSILTAIMSSRYCNMLNLLQGHVSESTYMGIVRNQVLVDVQGGNILYQIFTCKILHRRPAEEAPFLEFIQRVCSECKGEDGCPKKIKPGCGGFGIRNFLTLFLSIEVSKAIREVHGAQRKGEKANAIIAQCRVSCLTSQLNDSNPILSEISDSMTEESTYQMQMETAHSVGDQKMFTFWRARFEQAGRKKREANAKLMACSARYEKLMRSIRGGG